MADFFMKSTSLIVFIFLCCAIVSPASLTTIAGDSLKPGDVLNSTTKLCSATNRFCLQFDHFDNEAFNYLSLYSQMDDTWTLWVGNRNDPVVDNSGELTLNKSGELKIVSQGKPIEVLYSPNHPINNTAATLFDDGNFVLRQLHPNGSTKTVLWQSFDYPTEVLLPGMKLGVNHKTGHSWSLVSWITAGNPTLGDFTLEWEPIKGELIIRRRQVIYWRSGILRNHRSQENIPNDLIQRFEIVANEYENYLPFTPPKSNEDVSFLALNPSGYLYDGNTVIGNTDKCVGLNNDVGCQPFDLPTCRHHGQYVDARYGYIDFTDVQNSKNVKTDTNSSLTIVDCQQRCWSNCNCVAFFSIYDNDTGCTFLYNNINIITTFNPNENMPLIHEIKGSSHHKGKRKGLWIGVAVGGLLFTICVFMLFLALRRRKFQLKEKETPSSQTAALDLLYSNESAGINDLPEDRYRGHDLRILTYASVIEATNGFSSVNKLGEGGFGPVYKGILPTGKEIAVKRLSKSSGQGIVEFKNELTLICELQHTNLVQLVGCCIHQEERMLIYEFMPNKSLDFFLFDSTRSKLLDWQKRFNIIEGIAQGLLYLHKYSRLKIIHRDLKASNILLDENMNPKISDFGMARIFTHQESKANTHRIVGTYGYMSPEYAMDGVFSVKSDVYSFGVLLLEIVSSRRNNSFYNIDGPLSLIAHAWDLWKEGAGLQLMDQTLVDSYNYEEVLRCIHIGILCVEEDADDRPTMSNIMSILINKSVVLSMPKRPAIFYTRKKMSKAKLSSKESNTYSINEVTISKLDVR